MFIFNTLRNSTWRKARHSAMECGLTVTLVCSVLLCSALATGHAIITSNVTDCNNNITCAQAPKEMSKSKMPKVVKKCSNCCMTPGCIDIAATIIKNMDSHVDPCDDFYRFSCGGFLKNTIIPDDQTQIDGFSIVSDHLKEQLRESFEEESEPSDPRPFKLLKVLYQSCMNQTLIEAQGLDPLYRILKDLGGWPVLMKNWSESDFDWKESVYKFRRMGHSVNFFIDFSVRIDVKNNTKYVINLNSASLGLPANYLIQGWDNKFVDAYYKYMVDIAVILGADMDKACEDLKHSLDFEIALARISTFEEHRNMTDIYNAITLTELSQKFSAIPWLEYFNTLLAPITTVSGDELIIVQMPTYIKNLIYGLEVTPKRVQANYVMWRVVADSISFLNEKVRKQKLSYLTALYGVNKQQPRWKECVDIVSNKLEIAVGSLYVRKYFKKDTKKAFVEMVSNIKTEFKMILNKTDWMDEKTRKAAQDKVDAMSARIAYPDELLNNTKIEEVYAKLEITPGNYIQSMLNLSIFAAERNFENLRAPVNKSDWIFYTAATVVDASYGHQQNRINIPAGIMQGAFFSNDRPRYINYGAIGNVIGHEITHGFDNFGRQFDKEGNLAEWWEPETKKHYLERVQCIIEQYGNYTATEVNLHLNGFQTQGENIADNGGLKEAYMAYKEWAKKNDVEPMLPGLNYTAQQMFWISFANSRCQKYRPETLKVFITTDSHSPEEFRVIGPLSNIEEFAQDFRCPQGSRMNPKRKCTVW